MDSITGNDLTGLIAELGAGGLGERSCAMALAIVGRIYRHAARRLGWAGRNPVDLLDRHERPKPTRDRNARSSRAPTWSRPSAPRRSHAGHCSS